MDSRVSRFFGLLSLLLLPLAVQASELGHVMSFFIPLLIVTAIMVVGLAIFGIYANFFILPKLYSLSGRPLLAVRLLGVLMVIAICYLFNR